MTGDSSISVRTNLGFRDCLDLFWRKRRQHEFRVVAPLQFHREFEKTLGLHWRKYTVLVVWSPFYADQALLCDLDGGLFLPFNVLVAEDGSSTLLATTNHSLAGLSSGPIGIQVLVREFNRTMSESFREIAICGTVANRAALAGTQNEAAGAGCHCRVESNSW